MRINKALYVFKYLMTLIVIIGFLFISNDGFAWSCSHRNSFSIESRSFYEENTLAERVLDRSNLELEEESPSFHNVNFGEVWKTWNGHKSSELREELFFRFVLQSVLGIGLFLQHPFHLTHSIVQQLFLSALIANTVQATIFATKHPNQRLSGWSNRFVGGFVLGLLWWFPPMGILLFGFIGLIINYGSEKY